MNFFDIGCQYGPVNYTSFGICDDQNTTKAYITDVNPETWVAVVKNDKQKNLIFTAIDKCVIHDDEEIGRGRCDGMLTTIDLLYLIELKEKDPPWRNEAIEQLKSTIIFLRANHDLSKFKHKKAFACNKKRNAFVVIEHEESLAFFREYGFRLDIQAEVIIL